MRNNPTITVLMVEPHRHPYLKTVEHTLENLQSLVGGYITATYPWEDPVGLIADERIGLDVHFFGQAAVILVHRDRQHLQR